MPLIDKAIIGGDMQLSPTGDFRIVEDGETHLQTAQNRCVSRVNSWVHDPSFGSSLHEYVEKGAIAQLVKDDDIRTYVARALSVMLQDGRIKEILSVRIVARIEQTVYVEITVELGTQIGTITFAVSF